MMLGKVELVVFARKEFGLSYKLEKGNANTHWWMLCSLQAAFFSPFPSVRYISGINTLTSHCLRLSFERR